MSEILVTEADQGGTIAAKAGDTLAVQLPENPTTGFRWAPTAVDTNILHSLGDDFHSDARSGIGGGGGRVFRFLAKSRGSASIAFKLARAWEANPPTAVFEVRVNVT